MTYSGAIEYNPTTIYKCGDIARMMISYDKQHGPKGVSEYLYPDHTPIANVIATQVFSDVYNMFDTSDCPEGEDYNIVVIAAREPDTGYVVYARERYPTITQ